MPQAVYAINQINPNALIMVNAISNPVAGVKLSVMGNEFAVGDYLNYVCDAIFVETALVAAISENVVFIPATKTETTLTNKTIDLSLDNIRGLMEIIEKIDNNELIVTTGNAYVAAKMFEALNITVEHSALLGDVNGDGIVNLQDALGVLAYYVGEADALVDLYVADVTGDKVVNLQDALCILAWYVGEIDEFPAA